MTNIEMQTLAAVKEAAREYVRKNINWEQRRYELAKAALSGWLSNPNSKSDDMEYVASQCILYADKIINKLKAEQ